MNELFLMIAVPTACLVGGGMVARMYHQTEWALLCAVSTHLMLVFGVFVAVALAPESAALWLFVLLVMIVTMVFYWRRQFRTYDAQDFRDWLAKNEVPMDRLKDPAVHTHSRELCKFHPDEHLIWELPEAV